MEVRFKEDMIKQKGTSVLTKKRLWDRAPLIKPGYQLPHDGRLMVWIFQEALWTKEFKPIKRKEAH